MSGVTAFTSIDGDRGMDLDDGDCNAGASELVCSPGSGRMRSGLICRTDRTRRRAMRSSRARTRHSIFSRPSRRLSYQGVGTYLGVSSLLLWVFAFRFLLFDSCFLILALTKRHNAPQNTQTRAEETSERVLKGSEGTRLRACMFLCIQSLLRFRAPELLHHRLIIREGGQVVKERRRRGR